MSAARTHGTARAAARGGFTLMEILLVMALLGIILGIGSLGLERVDPGARGTLAALSTFLESTRDRARATGFPVAVEVQPPAGEDDAPRVVRYAFRPVLEANFEPAWSERHGLSFTDPARIGPPGRCGAGLDLRAGGGVQVAGRGGRLTTPLGAAVDFDVKPAEGQGATLFEWQGFMSLAADRAGVLTWEVEAGEGGQPLRLKTPEGAGLLPGRWQHLRLFLAEDRAQILIDGRLVAEAEHLGPLPAPREPPFLGDPDGRFHGMLDEFVVHARVKENGPELNEGVDVLFATPRLVYDAQGLLDAGTHPQEVEVRVLEGGTAVAEFLVGRFSEELSQ